MKIKKPLLQQIDERMRTMALAGELNVGDRVLLRRIDSAFGNPLSPARRAMRGDEKISQALWEQSLANLRVEVGDEGHVVTVYGSLGLVDVRFNHFSEGQVVSIPAHSLDLVRRLG